jgi:hypothetical protein
MLGRIKLLGERRQVCWIHAEVRPNPFQQLIRWWRDQPPDGHHEPLELDRLEPVLSHPLTVRRRTSLRDSRSAVAPIGCGLRYRRPEDPTPTNAAAMSARHRRSA